MVIQFLDSAATKSIIGDIHPCRKSLISGTWKRMSSDAKDLILKLLTLNPEPLNLNLKPYTLNPVPLTLNPKS
jgi:hypothetical protein